ncbi:DUF4192 domain-containing protein [Aeromicrobium massiliense]|uniref:DUF4192 domain-containing protein n=1 Tax=Aeromicrobium massiliense TaxID=1464554 RepID=UPI0005788AAE|nr:DUF4192 domain-containing protein [Aeromicrobium massiliense]
MTSRHVCHDVPDILDLLPALFGFVPHESLVAVATHGERVRFGFRLRLDLPAAPDVDAAARVVAHHLRQASPDGLVLVTVTDGDGYVADALCDAVADLLEPVPVVVAARTDGCSRYWLPGGPDEGTPYAPGTSPATVAAVLDGREILPSRDALVARYAAATGERRARAEAATEAAVDELVAARRTPGPPSLAERGRRALDEVRDAFLRTGRVPDDAALVRLGVWTAVPEVRDHAWWGLSRDEATVHLRLWTAAAPLAVAPFDAHVLAVAGFLAWRSGDGAAALVATERALAASPVQSLARTVHELLVAGVPPSRWDDLLAADGGGARTDENGSSP